eukprot:TRINITY_DN521_c0_g1_i1.p1 TRINITY_DN521_c0_g1~~TRINITY_DN521_c0_g1_i1.p1  ORF type:complete len:463 (-),score=57.10 TRINITY_DN521_c0_g1_i1:1107-2495(-)
MVMMMLRRVVSFPRRVCHHLNAHRITEAGRISLKEPITGGAASPLRFLSFGGNFGAPAGSREAHSASKEFLDFPGAKVPFTAELAFVPPLPSSPVLCFRVIDENGHPIPGSHSTDISRELAEKMYRHMVSLQAMDAVFYEAQRQGRFSFYVTSLGEEALNIASAAALSTRDVVFSQYREPGVLMWRGFKPRDFADQCFGNAADPGRGRQMPVHYGSDTLNFHTVSSPLATQIPHAVGAAYSLRNSGDCAVAYFGEGAASEGDFHAALNFAAVLETPVLFVCRNNGWAISTPTHEQYRGDGIAGRGQAYGMSAIRVDGNDAVAMYAAFVAARNIAVTENRPVLIEAMTYRVGHHSTSDDSSRYRGAEEMKHWKTQRDPVARFRKWLELHGWWDQQADDKLRADARAEVLAALEGAEKMLKPPLSDLYTDVYDVVPPNLVAQEEMIRKIVAKFPDDYPKDIPIQ